MKKIVFIILLLLVSASLVGCTKYSAKSFNDLTFERRLTAKEKQEAITKIEENFISFSKVTAEVNSFEKYGQIDNSQSINFTVTAYRNFYVHAEGKRVEESKESGVGFKIDEKTSFDLWDNSELNTIMHKSANGDDVEFTTLYNYLGAENPDDIKKNAYSYVLTLIKTIAGNYNNYDGYKTKDGYALVVSDKSEEYTPVNWGNTVKEYYELEESQNIVLINDDYQITEYVSYESYTTNRDPDTKEWYSRNKEISRNSVSIKVAYGSRKEKNDAANKLNEEYKQYLKDKDND